MSRSERSVSLASFQISYWAQFEQGVLTEDAVKILASVADSINDIELAMIHTRDLKKYWQVGGVIPWMRSKMVAQFDAKESNVPPRPKNKQVFLLYSLKALCSIKRGSFIMVTE